MARIVIVVEGGLVQEVFSSEKDTEVELIDLDTEEGQAAEADIKMPEHKVWRYTYYQQETAQIRQL